MANYMMDGPLEFAFEGDRVVIRGNSDGDRVTFTLRVADALITRHRFTEGYEAREAAGTVIEVDFRPAPQGHADTA